MIVISLLLALATLGAEPVLSSRGILNQEAPSWEVKDWFQLPKNRSSLDVTDFKGKVIYLYCFQSWCPGCHKYGFPTLKAVLKKFKDDPEIAIVAVQTTFEGYSHNGIKQAKEVAKKYELEIPIGQSGTRRERSKLMVNYRTGGTPWTIIIDKEGVVRYNDFHIDPQYAMKLMAKLKGERDQ